MTKETQDRVLTAIQNPSAKDWEDFFEFLRQRQYQQIRSAVHGEELLQIKANVKAFDLLQMTFNSVIKDKKLP